MAVLVVLTNYGVGVPVCLFSTLLEEVVVVGCMVHAALLTCVKERLASWEVCALHVM